MLGPRPFILYTADLEDHVAEHGVRFHAFTDDTQLYVHCRHNKVMSAVLRLENCIKEVSDWMSANCLKLNTDKTELLWTGSHHGPAMLGSAGPSLRLRTETLVASDQVHVLGVTMTSDLSMLPTFVRRASTGFVSSGGSDVHSMRSLRLINR